MFNSLYSIAFITLCLLLGYGIHFTIGGLPSSLYGMIIFTLFLHLRICNADKVKASIAWGLKHMGVCFVPAGVGIINHYQLIKTHGLTLVAITFISTFFILTFVGVVAQRFESSNKLVK